MTAPRNPPYIVNRFLVEFVCNITYSKLDFVPAGFPPDMWGLDPSIPNVAGRFRDGFSDVSQIGYDEETYSWPAADSGLVHTLPSHTRAETVVLTRGENLSRNVDLWTAHLLYFARHLWAKPRQWRWDCGVSVMDPTGQKKLREFTLYDVSISGVGYSDLNSLASSIFLNTITLSVNMVVDGAGLPRRV